MKNGVIIRESEMGDAGYVAYMHGRYYRKYHGLSSMFECYCLKYLADFVRNPEGGKLWIAEADGIIIGSSAVVRIETKTAQFRWFLVEKEYQGLGVGRSLFEIALAFCRECKYSDVFLWSYKGLDTARHIYDKAGFTLTEEILNHEWSSVEMIEQKLELKL